LFWIFIRLMEINEINIYSDHKQANADHKSHYADHKQADADHKTRYADHKNLNLPISCSKRNNLDLFS